MRTGARRRISAPPSTAWRLIGDFSQLAAWMPGVIDVAMRGSGIGAVRVCRTVRGVFEERLEAEARWSHEYAIVSGDLGVRSYRARLSVRQCDDADGCMIFWVARFDPATGVAPETARRTVIGLQRAGLDAIERHFRRP